MSQPDPPANDAKKSTSPLARLAGCAFGTIGAAFLILAALIAVTLGMCVTTGGVSILLLLVPIIAGLPLLIGASLVDAALYYWGWSSGRFSKATLPISVALILLAYAWLSTQSDLLSVFGLTRLEAGLAAIVMAAALIFIAFRIKPRGRTRD